MVLEIKQMEGFDKYTIDCYGGIYNKQRKKYVKPRVDRDGYLKIGIYNNEGKRKWFQLHRILALVFVKNPYNLPQVDHIDRCKLNNDIKNLRWASRNTQGLNRKSSLNSPLPNHISYANKRLDGTYRYYEIKIHRDGTPFRKKYRIDQFSLQQVLMIRDQIYKEWNIHLF